MFRGNRAFGVCNRGHHRTPVQHLFVCLSAMESVRGVCFSSTDAACCSSLLKAALVQRYWGIRQPAAEQWSSISLLQGTDSSSSIAPPISPSSPSTRYDYFSSAPPHHYIPGPQFPPPCCHFSWHVFARVQRCTFALCLCNMLRRWI